MGRLAVEEEAVSRDRGGPESEEGVGSVVAEEVGLRGLIEVGATALDLRLEPNPRPLKREFKELIRDTARVRVKEEEERGLYTGRGAGGRGGGRKRVGQVRWSHKAPRAGSAKQRRIDADD